MVTTYQKWVTDWLNDNGSNYAGPTYAYTGYQQANPGSTIFKSDFVNWYNDWQSNRATQNATPSTTAPPPAPPTPTNTTYAVEYGPNGEVWLVEYSGGGGYDKATGGGFKKQRRVVKDYTDMYKQIQGLPVEMENRGISNFDQWLKTTGRTLGDTTYQLSALSDLRAKLQGTDADNVAAWENAASGMGLTGDQLSNMMADLTMRIAGRDVNTVNMTPQELADYYNTNPEARQGILGSQQGLSPEELALRERMNRNSMREMQAASQKMLDNALGSSNSRAKYLMQADQYMTQIRDQDLQQRLAISQEDAARREQEYQATLQTWGAMYQAGQMGKEQFLANVRQNRSLEMQTISAEISTILQENQQYLQMYGADLQAFELYSQNLINSITTEMGMDTQLLDMTSELYAQAMAPYYTQLAEWQSQMEVYSAQQTQQQIDMAQQQQDWAQQQAETSTAVTVFGGILSFVGTILGAVLGGPIGAIIGGAIGGAVTAGGNAAIQSGGSYTYGGGNANAIPQTNNSLNNSFSGYLSR